MKPRIIFIHGNQTSHWSSCSWVPWLKGELEKQGFLTFFETFPDSIIAREMYWIPFLEEHIQAGEKDILVGWSSGGTAAMRYAEHHKILGSVLIAPCYTDLDDELERQAGYYDRPWDWDKIKHNQEHIALVYGDRDQFIPQEDFQYIAEQLDPTVLKISNDDHFIERETFPEVLKYLISLSERGQ